MYMVLNILVPCNYSNKDWYNSQLFTFEGSSSKYTLSEAAFWKNLGSTCSLNCSFVRFARLYAAYKNKTNGQCKTQTADRG